MGSSRKSSRLAESVADWERVLAANGTPKKKRQVGAKPHNNIANYL
jgi:hypothetical protein